jgi:thiol-disulfide isomerase/thioredoxin
MLGALGCGSEKTSRATGTAADAKEASDPLAKPEAADATKANPLVVLDYEGIQKLIAGHKGKVVVVDAWATYCPPCMRDFHHLVELHKQYGRDKVACVSLSFDFGDDAKLEELQPRIQAFLDRQGATFDNILSSETWDELYKKFDFAAVPAVFVYGEDGKLVARVDHSGDDETPIYDRVKALVKEHVGEEG